MPATHTVLTPPDYFAPFIRRVLQIHPYYRAWRQNSFPSFAPINLRHRSDQQPRRIPVDALPLFLMHRDWMHKLYGASGDQVEAQKFLASVARYKDLDLSEYSTQSGSEGAGVYHLYKDGTLAIGSFRAKETAIELALAITFAKMMHLIE